MKWMKNCNWYSSCTICWIICTLGILYFRHHCERCWWGGVCVGVYSFSIVTWSSTIYSISICGLMSCSCGISSYCGVNILITCVHSKIYVIDSHDYRDPCGSVGVSCEWVLAMDAGRGTGTSVEWRRYPWIVFRGNSIHRKRDIC